MLPAGPPAPVGRSSSTVELRYSADNIPSMDVASRSDPFLVIYQRTPAGSFVQLDATEVLMDRTKADWSKQTLMDWVFESRQTLRFILWDYDGKGSASHDYIGEATLDLGSIIGARGCTVTVALTRDPARGRAFVFPPTKPVTLTIRAAEVRGSMNDVFRFQPRGAGLDRKDFFGSSDPYLVLLRLQPDGSRVKLWENAPIMNTLSPNWPSAELPLQRICNGDLSVPLIVQCWDFDRMSSHDLIGEFPCNLNDLITAAAAGSGFTLINPKKQAKKGASYKGSGTIFFRSAAVVHIPSFLEYLQGGCALNLVTAIDFTGSNGDPRSPGSLHYFGNPAVDNEYLQAIRACGEILLPYDSDGKPAVYGFGGQIGAGPANHCFALTWDERNPEVAGLQGMVTAYKNAFSAVALSGPTYFAPIIRRAAEIASEGISQAHQKYTVLLLLTDGQCNDIEATTEAIIDASSLPLSIVIVGVGGADFSAMDFLDADGGRLSIGRKVAFRDIVQFVPFRKYAAYGAGAGSLLAREVLAEIPGQCVAAMSSRGIVPNPPPGGGAGAGGPAGAAPMSAGAGAVPVDLRIPTYMPAGFAAAAGGMPPAAAGALAAGSAVPIGGAGAGRPGAGSLHAASVGMGHPVHMGAVPMGMPPPAGVPMGMACGAPMGHHPSMGGHPGMAMGMGMGMGAPMGAPMGSMSMHPHASFHYAAAPPGAPPGYAYGAPPGAAMGPPPGIASRPGGPPPVMAMAMAPGVGAPGSVPAYGPAKTL